MLATVRVVSDDAVEVIRRMGIAFNARDYEAMGEFLDTEAEFFDHMPLPDVSEAAQGREEIAAVLDAWSRGFSGFEADVEAYHDLGEFVVCETRWRFVSRDAGIELEWKGAEAWQVRDGKVVWGHAGLRDKRAAMEAADARRREIRSA